MSRVGRPACAATVQYGRQCPRRGPVRAFDRPTVRTTFHGHGHGESQCDAKASCMYTRVARSHGAGRSSEHRTHLARNDSAVAGDPTPHPSRARPNARSPPLPRPLPAPRTLLPTAGYTVSGRSLPRCPLGSITADQHNKWGRPTPVRTHRPHCTTRRLDGRSSDTHH